MPGPWLEKVDRVLADPSLDPAKRSALESKKERYLQKVASEGAAPSAGAGGGSGGVPLRQAGEAMEDVDPYVLDIKASEAALQTPPKERLPSSHFPRSYIDAPGMAAPIMYEGDSDEGWRQAMEQGTAEGRPAYRVQEEFPLNLDPMNLAVRGALSLGGLASGADKSLSLGIGQKLIGGGLEMAGIRGAGKAFDEMRENSPVASGVGRLAGALSPVGAAGRIGAGATRLLGAPSAGVAGRALGAGAAGALAGGAQAGGESIVDRGFTGETPTEAFDAAKIGAAIGPITSLIGSGADWMRRGLRDTDTAPGRDLVRALAAGAKTSMLSGIKPSPAMQQLSEEGRAAGGYSSEAMAVRKAATLLGDELSKQQAATLGGARAVNQELYQQGAQTSAAPVLNKALGVIRDATHGDGSLLPGVNVRGVADVAKRTSNVRMVSRTDPSVAEAGENVMDVGLARRLGLISRGSQANDGEMVVLLEPKQMTTKDLDVMTRAFDDAGAVGSGVDKVKARPFRGLGAAAREAREGLGPEVAAAKAQQSEQLNQMGNAMEASGLPRRTEGIDINDVGTRNALEGGVRRFRTDQNLANDMELERVAHLQKQGTPTVRTQLGESLEAAAGSGAMQRVKEGASMLPYPTWQGARLRLDPIMGAMGNIRPGVVPATSTELARQFRRRR